MMDLEIDWNCWSKSDPIIPNRLNLIMMDDLPVPTIRTTIVQSKLFINTFQIKPKKCHIYSKIEKIQFILIIY